jgi:hypothetical protein
LEQTLDGIEVGEVAEDVIHFCTRRAECIDGSKVGFRAIGRRAQDEAEGGAGVGECPCAGGANAS